MIRPARPQAIPNIEAPDPPRNPDWADFGGVLFVVVGLLVLGAWFVVEVYG